MLLCIPRCVHRWCSCDLVIAAWQSCVVWSLFFVVCCLLFVFDWRLLYGHLLVVFVVCVVVVFDVCFLFVRSCCMFMILQLQVPFGDTVP